MKVKGKINLVYSTPFGTVYEHIGIASIGSYMKEQGYEVKIICLEASSNYLQDIIENSPDIVGFNTVTSTVETMLKIAYEVKNKISTFTVLGGVGVSGNPEEILEKNPFIDTIILGEGELTFREMADRLVLGESLLGCEGIVHRYLGVIKCEHPRDLISDLDILPYPLRDIYLNNKEAMSGYLGSVMLEASRGCMGNCSFCDNYSMRQQKGPIYRAKSVKKVVGEIQYLISNFGVKRIHFQDRTFEDPGKKGMDRIYSLANEIIKQKIAIEFSICSRAENWNEQNEFILMKLKEAGLFVVQVGIESGNETTLKLFNKRATVDDNIRIINLLKKNDIIIDPGFIMFHPYNTFNELKNNMLFLESNGLAHIRKLFFLKLELTPNTDITNRIISDGLAGDDYLVNTYSYNYLDKQIGILSECIFDQFSDDPITTICDKLHFEFSYLVRKIKILSKNNPSLSSLAYEVEIKQKEIFHNIAKLNIKYFDDLIFITEHHANREEIQDFINSYDPNPFYEYEHIYKKIRMSAYHRLKREGIELYNV